MPLVLQSDEEKWEEQVKVANAGIALIAATA